MAFATSQLHCFFFTGHAMGSPTITSPSHSSCRFSLHARDRWRSLNSLKNEVRGIWRAYSLGMRRFIYQYSGNNTTEDMEEGVKGTTEIPEIGSVITRNGREWKVVRVIAPAGLNGAIPIVRVFVNDATRGMERNSRRKSNSPRTSPAARSRVSRAEMT